MARLRARTYSRIMVNTSGYAAQSGTSPLAPFNFVRRAPGPRDVQIDILFCGVCHSDLHTARNQWKDIIFPVVPGHEIVGRVTTVGDQVTRTVAGDLVAVGCMVNSCRTCASCAQGLEQYCEHEITFTYNSRDLHQPGLMTYGGYSTSIVVDEHFVFRVPSTLNPAAAAPLLCAGITTYSPLRRWSVGPGQTVGVVGLGGLGHMGLKLAHAFGAHTVLFTTSASKTEDAKRLGADEVVVTTTEGELQKHANRFDFILNTVAVSQDLDPYLAALKRDGALCLVGVPEHQHKSPDAMTLLSKRRQVVGSMIVGIPETQEMLDFCGKHGIAADIEIILMQEINQAYERMLRSDVKYRFVIDMESLKKA